MTDNGSTFGPLYYNAGMRGMKGGMGMGGSQSKNEFTVERVALTIEGPVN